jgi:hypothetical protein
VPETSCHHGSGQHSPGINAANKKACAGQELLPAATLSSTKNEQAFVQNLEARTTTSASAPAFFVSSNRNAFRLKWLNAPLDRTKDSPSTVLQI